MTFEQAEGTDPLPSQLKLKQLSPQLRALLWEAISRSLQRSHYNGSDGSELLEPWEGIFYAIHVHRDHGMADDFRNDYYELIAKAKEVIAKGNYASVFGWIQFVLRSHPPGDFAESIQSALDVARAAYRVVDGDTIVPIGSEAEFATLVRAFADLEATEFHGTRKHLRNAAEELTKGNNPGSIRESIHAVESVVRVLEPQGDFAKALAKLDAKVGIHGAMKAGFGNLYGYTSDKEDIRHSLLQEPAPSVDETDALFMLGACAAFVSYVINKSRLAGLLT